MAVVSMLPNAEIGRNDHRENEPHFIIPIIAGLNVTQFRSIWKDSRCKLNQVVPFSARDDFRDLYFDHEILCSRSKWFLGLDMIQIVLWCHKTWFTDISKRSDISIQYRPISISCRNPLATLLIGYESYDSKVTVMLVTFFTNRTPQHFLQKSSPT